MREMLELEIGLYCSSCKALVVDHYCSVQDQNAFQGFSRGVMERGRYFFTSLVICAVRCVAALCTKEHASCAA